MTSAAVPEFLKYRAGREHVLGTCAPAPTVQMHRCRLCAVAHIAGSGLRIAPCRCISCARLLGCVARCVEAQRLYFEVKPPRAQAIYAPAAIKYIASGVRGSGPLQLPLSREAMRISGSQPLAAPVRFLPSGKKFLTSARSAPATRSLRRANQEPVKPPDGVQGQRALKTAKTRKILGLTIKRPASHYLYA